MIPPKVLSSAEIAAIVNNETMNSAHVAKWPTTADKERLLDAVDRRVKLVEFENGDMFTLRYSESTSWKVSNGKHSSVFVSPLGGEVAPCGWFSAESLRRDLLGTAA